jgi:hypothetical protein
MQAGAKQHLVCRNVRNAGLGLSAKLEQQSANLVQQDHSETNQRCLLVDHVMLVHGLSMVHVLVLVANPVAMLAAMPPRARSAKKALSQIHREAQFAVLVKVCSREVMAILMLPAALTTASAWQAHISPLFSRILSQLAQVAKKVSYAMEGMFHHYKIRDSKLFW